MANSWNRYNAVLSENRSHLQKILMRAADIWWPRVFRLYVDLYRALGRIIGTTAVSLKKKLALHNFIKLRQRYIFTRGNRVRLRYVASTLGVFAVLAASLMQPAAASFMRKFQKFQPVNAQMIAQGDIEQVLVHNDLASAEGVSEGIRRAAVSMKKAPKRPNFRQISVDIGDTIAGVLEKAGVSKSDSYHVVKALSEHYDPRNVKPGQKINVQFKPTEDGGFELVRMGMQLSPVKEVTVEKQSEEDFKAELAEKELQVRQQAHYANIETSLYGSAARAGLPAGVIAEVIRVYSWDIDFQRDIRRGDKIEVLYDVYETEDGEIVKYGDVLYASLSVGGKDIPIYRHEMSDGRVDYFEPDGHSIRKTLMKTPIDGARLSSGFGMRKHPVLGYNKMHKGVDFAAPTGTPIYAAGDGTISFAGRKGGYGNYVQLRHNSTLKTAYAHMHKFAKGISQGKRVSQGDVIGYVGTTGRSTGPHLHYEVLVNNGQVNPNSVDLPTGEQLEGEELKAFQKMMGKLHKQYVSLTEGMKFAHKDSENPYSKLR